MKEVTVYAPATIANMVCGFDILGFAIKDPRDRMVVRLLNERRVSIINLDNYNLPVDPLKNVSGKALLALLDAVPGPIGFEIESTKQIKPGSGIGSSAASAIAAVAGANRLLGNRFSNRELIEFAMFGEELASGSKHADNIAPCLYGGVTLVRNEATPDIITIPAPPLFVTVIHPQIEVKTSDAREILKKQVLLKDAIIQWGNIAGLVAGLMKGDYQLISRCLKDVIIEPVRSILIPIFDEVKQRSMDCGALGGGISGSGPSVFMLSRDERTARVIEKAITDLYTPLDIDFRTYVTTINYQGVEIVDQ